MAHRVQIGPQKVAQGSQNVDASGGVKVESLPVTFQTLSARHRVVASLLQPIPIPCESDVPWSIPSADVFETSVLSCGVSLVMSSVKSVASWLAREMET